MTLLYAVTFTDALTHLSAQEQKQVKVTTVDLMIDPRGNGHQMHRVEASPGFWTARVSQDIRIVLHRDGEQMLLAWVGHHDEAYRWAERRRLAPHERTGAMQLVELVETVEEFGRAPLPAAAPAASPAVPSPPPDTGQVPVDVPPLPSRPFAALSDDQLLDVGVPRDWLEPVRQVAMTDVDALFAHLPAEAAEALLDHATGGRLADHVVAPAAPGTDPFAHPDALRRFRVLDNVEELQAALDQPFEKWAVFLHPVQRALVDRDWSGPVRVSGSAGTGKTIVALHRAVHLAQDATARVLLTTFSKPLARALARKCDILTEAARDVRGRVTVATLDQAALDLYTAHAGQPTMATPSQIRAAIKAAREAGLGGTLSDAFLAEEWAELVDAWNVTSFDTYLAIPRIGRRTRLGPVQREAAWAVFAFVRERLAARGLVTWPHIYGVLTERLESAAAFPFTHVIVDEAQDLTVAQMRFLAAIARRQAGERDDSLFFAGDQGQRIFHLPFSWTALGVDIRGRGQLLKVNYRTSHQIRSMADRLLPATLTDMDGNSESRSRTVSIFDGPDPLIILADDEGAERDAVAGFLRDCLDEGMVAAEIGVLVRGQDQLARARAAVTAAGLDWRDEAAAPAIVTMHEAKGLEYRAVAVIACDEDVLPDPARLAAVGDAADLEMTHETERQLLYVACTRARDKLLISGVEPGSEFLDDVMASQH